jgi:hypothetical protein
MGAAQFGEPAGQIRLSQSEPSPLFLASPVLLRYSMNRADVEVIVLNGEIRQITAPQALANVETISQFKYELRFFYPSQVGAKGGNGLYTVSGAPFVTWTVENPDASETALR